MLSPTMRLAAPLLMLGLVTCGGDGKQEDLLAPEDNGQIITDTVSFADPGLERAVRIALGDTIGVLDLDRVTAITQFEAKSRGIASLDGIGQLAHLIALNLQDNQISDLTPLAALTDLQYLDLSDNRVQDLSSLATLSHLAVLILDRNQVRDLAPLQGLTTLQSVALADNPADEAAVAALRGRGVEVEWPNQSKDDLEPDNGNTGPDPRAGAGAHIVLNVVTADGMPRVWATTPDGSRWVAFAYAKNSLDLALAPDGRALAYTDYDTLSHSYDIFRVKVGDDLLLNLTSDRASDRYPVWSPDGNTIAFVSGRNGDSEIYLVSADGGTAVNLTNHPLPDYNPCWSPDGHRLAFVSERDGAVDIWLMDADGASLVNLTRSRARDEQPAWSPDGQHIAFVSLVNGERAVCVIQIDGSGMSLVSTVDVSGGFFTGGYPTWSPDGQRLAFVDNDALHLVNPDGSNPVVFQTVGKVWLRPCWVADLASGFLGAEAASAP